jgi:hypothetical protein
MVDLVVYGLFLLELNGLQLNFGAVADLVLELVVIVVPLQAVLAAMVEKFLKLLREINGQYVQVVQQIAVLVVQELKATSLISVKHQLVN